MMCHMSCVACRMSLFNYSQTVRAADLQLFHNINHTQRVMCLVSHVRCHMSLVTCHVSQFYFIHFYKVAESVGEGSAIGAPADSAPYAYFQKIDVGINKYYSNLGLGTIAWFCLDAFSWVHLITN